MRARWITFVIIGVVLAVGIFAIARFGLPSYYFAAGKAYAADGELAAARRAYERALSFNSRYLPAVEGMAIVLYRLNAISQSKTYVDRAIDLGSKDLQIWMIRASFVESTDEREALVEKIKETMRRRGETGDLHFAAGLIEVMDGKFASAREHLGAALRLDPAREMRYRTLIADSYLREERAEDAIAILRQIDIGQYDSVQQSNYYAMLAVAYAKAGDYNQALQLALRARDLDPQSSSPWDALGFIYAKTGQTALAIQSFEQFLKLAALEPFIPASSVRHAEELLRELRRQ